jgi:hypothetical protein
MIVAAVAALTYSAQPVEARSGDGSAALVRRVFADGRLPIEPDAMGQAAVLPEGKGKDLVQKKCTMCHAANIFTSQKHTKEQWGSVLDNMTSKGLEASDEELDTILDYLTQNFAPVAKTPDASAPPATTPPAR